MLMSLPLPAFGSEAVSARIVAVHAEEGMLLSAGASFLDLAVDFSGGVVYNCAPVSYYRIILRDRAWLRRLLVEPDDDIAPQALLALFGTEADEDVGGAPAREARVTLMSIVAPDTWWNDPA